MIKTTLLAGAVVIVGWTAALPKDRGQDDPGKLADTLKGLIKTNMEALAKEDLDAMMETLHPDSPGFNQNRAMSRQLFSTYDLSYRLISSRYIGTDGEYAVMRFNQETTRKAGPPFRDNTLDGLHVFRKHGRVWKLWTSAILEVTYGE